MHIYVGALRFGLLSFMLEDGFDAYLRGGPKVWLCLCHAGNVFCVLRRVYAQLGIIAVQKHCAKVRKYISISLIYEVFAVCWGSVSRVLRCFEAAISILLTFPAVCNRFLQILRFYAMFWA